MRFFCRTLILPLVLVFGIQQLAFAQYSNLPSMGDTARNELTPIMEYNIGTEIMQQIKTDPDYVNDEVLVEYLNSIGHKLVAATPEVRGEAGYSFFFFGIRDSSINAFALPGGYIGVHTGLLVAAQSESELASVLSHEIGHVSQRHIARMINQQKQDMLIPIASLLLAAIAGVSKNADAASALLIGGQGLAIQKQLNFSRDAEREADRVGFLILKNAGFDTTGMTAFFERLQRSSRLYGEGISAYLRTHPLTTERIADIESRVRGESYKQHADSSDFYFIKIRAQLLQDTSARSRETTEAIFEEQVKKGNRVQVAAGYYGQALMALNKNDTAKANDLLQQAVKTIGDKAAQDSLALISTSIDIKLKAKRPKEAEKEVLAALARFPTSRSLSHQYASALYDAGEYSTLTEYLRKQAQIYRSDPLVHGMLAKVYGAQGKIALMHIELAESYSLSGGLSAALEQLNLARQAPDVTFYEQSIIDAREREWQSTRMEKMRK